jgi:hypothetical protein
MVRHPDIITPRFFEALPLVSQEAYELDERVAGNVDLSAARVYMDGLLIQRLASPAMRGYPLL